MSNYSLAPEEAKLASSPPIAIVLAIILLVFFVIGFFSIYFCRCFMDSVASSLHLRRSPSGNQNPDGAAANPGLDPSLIQYFPTFTYSSVKDYRREKYGFECAICLAEFVEDDMLRLLTVCCHVFHQECVDLWLLSHKTCPVCRQDLDLPKETLEKAPMLENNIDIIDGPNNELNHSVSITIREDDDVAETRQGNGWPQIEHSANNRQGHLIERFSRSHSTGHSIYAGRGDNDKYTLRLQEHVKVNITRGHCAAESCITFGDFSSPKNGGLGELSGCASSGEDINKT